MNYIDLFSGIGGFHQGLVEAGFKFDKCYHSEIDKHAKSIYQKHFPESEDLGDVTRIDVSRFPVGKYIVTGGWPCQDNSIAGKRKGQSGGLRSSLFSEIIRILSELISMGSSVIFIGENVKGLYSVNDKVDFHDTITRLTDLDTDSPQLNLEVQLLNTRWFLPQNRERIYFVGYSGKGSGQQVFPIGEGSIISQGSDREKQGKAKCASTVRPGLSGLPGNSETYVRAVMTPERPNKSQHGRITKGPGEPMFTLTGQDKHGIEVGPFIEQKGRGFNKGGKKDICPPITSNAFEHNNHIITHENKSGIKTDHSESCALRSGASHNYQIVNRIRRLTPVECERLQGFKDNWTLTGIIYNTPKYISECAKKGNVTEEYVLQKISDTQRYKCVGNSVSVPVVRAIAIRIKQSLFQNNF